MWAGRSAALQARQGASLAPEPPPWAPPSEDSLCTHSPSVQFLESSRVPLQSRPPFWGGGAMHSRLRQCAHSVLQADHLLHSVHPPSTVGTQHVVRGDPGMHGCLHTRLHVPSTAVHAHAECSRARGIRDTHRPAREIRESEEHSGAKTAPDTCVRSPTQTQHKGLHTGKKPRVKNTAHSHKHITREGENTDQPMGIQDKTRGKQDCSKMAVRGQVC